MKFARATFRTLSFFFSLNFFSHKTENCVTRQMGYRKRANQSEIGRILGVHAGTVSKVKHEPDCPEFDDKAEAQIYAFCLWWDQRERQKNPQQQRTVPPGSEDELLTGDGTEGLERYRLARAQQEEIKLAELRGHVVKLNDFNESAAAVFAPWRRVAEHAKRMGDEDMFQMIAEANQEVLTGLERLYGCDDSDRSDELD